MVSWTAGRVIDVVDRMVLVWSRLRYVYLDECDVLVWSEYRNEMLMIYRVVAAEIHYVLVCASVREGLLIVSGQMLTSRVGLLLKRDYIRLLRIKQFFVTVVSRRWK